MHAPKTGSKSYAALMFIAISVLCGVLLAGMMMPIVTISAAAMRASSEGLKNLPADLAIPPQHEASKILLADGSELARFYDENRVYVPLNEISKQMRDAQVAIEDHRFYEHGAIDPQSVVRAALGNIAGGSISGGGSTLTQQYIKQARIQMCNGDSDCVAKAQEPTIERKILEMRYAIALERQLSKDEILERYLNIAYYGDGAYGVQAAARHYFGKSAKDLDVAEAAMLAGLVQNPGQSDPIHNLDAALARRDAVLDAQVRYQGMDPAIADEARQVGFDASKVSHAASGCVGTRYPFICDYAARILTSDQMPSLGSDPESRRDTLNRAGLTITLHIDPTFQDYAQDAVSSVVGPRDEVIAVADTVDPKTGHILAMAQSRPHMGSDSSQGETFKNYSVSQKMGGAEGFAYGSTFKIWTLAAAIQQGHFPDTTYFNVQRTMNWRGQSFKGCGDDSFTLESDYTTTNAVAGQDSGTFNGVRGMMWSVNNYFIKLEQVVGPCAAVDMAKRAGVELAFPQDGPDGIGKDLDSYAYVPSFTLGSPMVTPLSMASAYGTFANRGKHCSPVLIKSVHNRDGVELPIPDANCRQVIDEKVADGVNYVMQKTHQQGLSSGQYIPNGIAQASKTGTSDNAVSASAFVGYTPDLSTSVIIAGDTTAESWKATPEADRNVAFIPLEPLGGALGMRHAGIIWRPMMERMMEGMPESQFEPWNPPPAPQGGQSR